MSAYKTAYRKAERFLAKTDPVMAGLIDAHGPCRIHLSNHSLFHSLASAVIGQQLSVKAAETIQRRVMAITSNPLSPKKYLAASIDELRGAGLSGSKTQYITTIARAVSDGAISKQKLRHMGNAEVIQALTAIKGIGVWTAEMYLMFGLKRMDVVSFGDLGLQRAARELYNGGKEDKQLLTRISENWRPYRTVACWYLWEATD